MKEKWTKGPWHVHEFTRDDSTHDELAEIRTEHGGPIVYDAPHRHCPRCKKDHVMQAYRWHIAKIAPPKTNDYWCRNMQAERAYLAAMADAHLIAAAPEMYEALEAITRKAPPSGPLWCCSDEIESARAALKKARGER